MKPKFFNFLAAMMGIHQPISHAISPLPESIGGTAAEPDIYYGKSRPIGRTFYGATIGTAKAKRAAKKRRRIEAKGSKRKF